MKWCWALVLVAAVPAMAAPPPALRADLTLDVHVEGQRLAGHVELSVGSLVEPLEGVVSVFLMQGEGSGRRGLRQRHQALTFQLLEDGTRTFVLGEDLVHDLAGLPASEYSVRALVVLEGVDTWKQVEARSDIQWPPTRQLAMVGSRWTAERTPEQSPVLVDVSYDVVISDTPTASVELTEVLEVRGASPPRKRRFEFRVRARAGNPRRVLSPWRLDLPAGEYLLVYRVEADGFAPLRGETPFRVGGENER